MKDDGFLELLTGLCRRLNEDEQIESIRVVNNVTYQSRQEEDEIEYNQVSKSRTFVQEDSQQSGPPRKKKSFQFDNEGHQPQNNHGSFLRKHKKELIQEVLEEEKAPKR